MKKQEKLIVRARAATDIGQRTNNEDAYLVDEKMGLFIVADGMGGCDKGEVASWFTSENLEQMTDISVSQNESWTIDPLDVGREESLLEYAVMAINKRLYERNEEEAKKWETTKAPKDPIEKTIAERLKKKHRMGTTLVSFLIRDYRAYLAHVGDSRAYRIEGSSIKLLTHDHSWVDEKIREGLISPEEAKGHKMRNVITRSVGFKEEVEADIDVITLYPPERFLLCSDGLSNVVKEDELFSFAKIENLEIACHEMVTAAKAKGGKDNITAVLVEITTPTKGGKVEMPPRDIEDITELPL